MIRAPAASRSIEFLADFLSPGFAAEAFSALRMQIPWEQHRIQIFGRRLAVPRLSCWIGDPGAVYVYSRTLFEPHGWTPLLLAMRRQLTECVGVPFNSVLANLYRSGADSMGWHADDEPELGAQPTIASISLGGTRRFVMRERGGRRISRDYALTSGSLLLMRGDSQSQYQHAVPKTAKPVAPRINLTFRQVIARPKLAASQTGGGKSE